MANYVDGSRPVKLGGTPYFQSPSPRSMSDIDIPLTSNTKDAFDLKQNLAVLRGLSENEKNDNAFLQSRLDDQSKLIMMLKQNSDEKGQRLDTLERINKELTKFRTEAEGNMKIEVANFTMVDRRFNELAENHVEMIKIKDDYKRRNMTLTEENAQLREDNAKLFSKAIHERDMTITELVNNVDLLKDRIDALKIQNREVIAMVSESQQQHETEVSTLTEQLAETKKQLKAATLKGQESQVGTNSLNSKNTAKISALSKENEELLQLSMSRGKIIQDKVGDNKDLQLKIQSMEKNVREMHLKFDRQADDVNANLQVQRLRAELKEADEKMEKTIREYDAYKKHTGQLMDKEKSLNRRLTKLVG